MQTYSENDKDHKKQYSLAHKDQDQDQTIYFLFLLYSMTTGKLIVFMYFDSWLKE